MASCSSPSPLSHADGERPHEPRHFSSYRTPNAGAGGEPTYEPSDDPGVVCVSRMYSYYKKFGHEGKACMQLTCSLSHPTHAHPRLAPSPPTLTLTRPTSPHPTHRDADIAPAWPHPGTICMPASWRPSRGTSDPSFAIDEIVALAGVDRMT